MTVPSMRVAIVDDDAWVRRGRAAALGEIDSIEIVGAWSHAEALEQRAPAEWAALDVVMVDAHDEEAGFDRFIGVSVVQHVRSLTGREVPRIVVVTGHTFNDLLRIRMAEAGADHLYSHAEVRSIDALVRVLRDSVSDPAGGQVSGGATRARAADSGLNAAVAWAADNLGEEAFQHESQKALPLTRRTIIGARQRLGNMVGGSRAESPTWKELTALLDRARGKERRGDGR